MEQVRQFAQLLLQNRLSNDEQAQIQLQLRQNQPLYVSSLVELLDDQSHGIIGAILLSKEEELALN